MIFDRKRNGRMGEMTPEEALAEVANTLEDWGSFLESFEREDRLDAGEDRLERYRVADALEVLRAVVDGWVAAADATDRKDGRA